MGLDIYLYHFLVDPAEALQREREYWTRVEGDEGEGRNGPQGRAIALELGLNEEGEHPGKVPVEINYTQYPDHIFKIGYWRSSYNESGINNLLRCNFNTDLYGIMRHEADEDWQHPNWEECSTRVKELLESFRERRGDIYQVLSARSGGSGPSTPNEAMQLFRTERERARGTLRSYSSGIGEFWLDEPVHVHAVILSQSHGTWLIVKAETDWYLQALEIVKETCDYVLDQDDPERHLLRWSG